MERLLVNEHLQRELPLAHKGRIVLDYGETIVMETPATGSFENKVLGGQYLLGTAAGGPLEVVPGMSLRWRQQGIEIEVEGLQTTEMADLARQIAPDLILPDPAADLVGVDRAVTGVEQADDPAARDGAEAGREGRVGHCEPGAGRRGGDGGRLVEPDPGERRPVRR